MAVSSRTGQPTRGSDRVQALDTVRGLALFGILLVNVRSYAMGDFVVASPLDEGLDRFMDLFVYRQVYPLFALLFGLGIGIQCLAGRTTSYFVRRLGVLFLIGAVHAVFIWSWDILHRYAAFGFVLLAFRRAPSPVLLASGVLMLTIPTLVRDAADVLGFPSLEAPGDFGEGRAAVYETASYLELTRLRAADFLRIVLDWANWIRTLDILGMFLIGYWAGARRKVIAHAAENLDFLRRVAAGTLVVALVGQFWGVVMNAAGASPPDALTEWVRMYRRPAWSMFYGSFAFVLASTGAGARVLRPVAAAGRMALTTYLVQSVIATLLFYGYGAGLYGTLSTSTGEALALLLFGVQLVFSAWWLSFARFGPTEWVWRSLTYGRRFPLLR